MASVPRTSGLIVSKYQGQNRRNKLNKYVNKNERINLLVLWKYQVFRKIQSSVIVGGVIGVNEYFKFVKKVRL